MGVFKRYSFTTQVILFTIATFAILALRYGSVHFVSNSLWAEDGIEFYPKASQLGFASLVQPYQGALYLYQRVPALVSTAFGAEMIPFVFFLGWLGSILVLFWASRKALAGRPYFEALAFFTPLLVLLQPHTGETFLTLTNAGWWLGCSLALMASMPWMFGNKTLPVAAILSLTGPFSILVFPVALVQCIRHKCYALLATISIGASIQIATLLISPRNSQEFDTNISHWVSCAVTFFTFGSDSLFTRLASGVFWVGFAVSMVRPSKGSWGLVIFGLITFSAALYSLKGMPQILSPISNGSRYFVIPYAMSIMALINNTKKFSISSTATLASLCCLIISSFSTIQQDNTYYRSYAKFANFESELIIPLAPINPNAEIFKIEIPSPGQIPGLAVDNIEITPGLVKVANNICAGSRNVGFAISLTLPKSERITLQWRDEKSSEFKTLHRFYEAGEARVQLAFSKNKRPVDLYIKTDGTSSKISEKKQVVACF